MENVHKEKILEGTLSLLLPGLGQLHSKHYLRAFFFFAVFSLLEFFSSTRPFLPLLVITASVEAFRSAPPSQAEYKRNSIYAATGLLGFLSWVMLYFPSIHSVGDQLRVNEEMEMLQKNLVVCQKNLGRYAVTLEECFKGRESLLLDPWGTRYVLSMTSPEGFEIHSAGPDKEFKTPDDYTYHFR